MPIHRSSSLSPPLLSAAARTEQTGREGRKGRAERPAGTVGEEKGLSRWAVPLNLQGGGQVAHRGLIILQPSARSYSNRQKGARSPGGAKLLRQNVFFFHPQICKSTLMCGHWGWPDSGSGILKGQPGHGPGSWTASEDWCGPLAASHGP